MATPDEPEVPEVRDESTVRARDVGALRMRRLEPVQRPGLLGWLRPRFGRPVLWLGWAVAAVLGLVLIDRPSGLDCKVAMASKTPAVALSVCRREYAETHNPAIGVELANRLRQDEQFDAARELAVALLETPERASAFRVLGKVALDDDRGEEDVRLVYADTMLRAARQLHHVAHDAMGEARDDQALADVLNQRSQYSDALFVLDDCLQLATHAGDKVIELYCRLAAVRVLSLVGDFKLAEREIGRAAALATSDRDRGWLEYQRGNLYQDYERAPQKREHDRRAIAAFEQSLAYNERARVMKLVLTTELNMAYSLAEIGEIASAEHHLAVAQSLDLEGRHKMQCTEIAARIAFRSGDLARARSLNDAVYRTIDIADDRIEVAVMQAQIALASNDLKDGETWAGRGVTEVEKIRAAEPLPELRAYVLSTRRKPYELLFVALARAGRTEEAAIVLDRWQGQTQIDALAEATPASSRGLGAAANRVASLAAWLPVVSRSRFTGAADRTAVRAALQTTDLLALVVAHGDLWRFTATRGRSEIADLGPLTDRQDALDRFRAAPTDPTLAEPLGELLVANDAARATTAPLHVLLDAPLAALPVVALRRHRRPLIALRPVVRVLRLSETSCVAAPAPVHATVIADAESDLPDARREAAEIAKLFDRKVTLGVVNDATSGLLFTATEHDLLHVAVHAEVKAGGGVLKLRDRDVPALEISARKLGPSLVVLSACSSASANDVGLGSLASAFLAAGSSQVIATLRKVPDAGASRLTTRFYRAGGVTDPVRVLAKIQSELADAGDEDWPSFAVFGHDVCSQP